LAGRKNPSEEWIAGRLQRLRFRSSDHQFTSELVAGRFVDRLGVESRFIRPFEVQALLHAVETRKDVTIIQWPDCGLIRNRHAQYLDRRQQPSPFCFFLFARQTGTPPSSLLKIKFRVWQQSARHATRDSFPGPVNASKWSPPPPPPSAAIATVPSNIRAREGGFRDFYRCSVQSRQALIHSPKRWTNRSHSQLE